MFLARLVFVCCCFVVVVVYFGGFGLCLSLFWGGCGYSGRWWRGCLLLGLVISWVCVGLLDIYFGVFIGCGFA